MKLAVFSDLHTEFYKDPISNGPIPRDTASWLSDIVDAVALTGDIGIGISGIWWAKTMFPDTPVLYILGNHEFYDGGDIERTLKDCREEADDSQIYVLENDIINIGGFVIFGATLWTDFQANGKPYVSKIEANKSMNDFRTITYKHEKLTPSDTVELHRFSRSKIQEIEPDIVLSHHGPHMDVQPPQFRYGDLAPAFTSDLTHLDVPLWICGHTHHCCDFVDQGTRYISNQAGYPNEPMHQFDEKFVLNLRD